MGRKTTAFLIMVLAGLLIWGSSSSKVGSLALEGRDVPVQAAVSPLLQYQGRLTDPATGDSVTDGNYTITFRLYDDQAGTTELWEETKDVAVVNGLFSTALGDEDPLDQSLFDGRELWLGVKVGADSEATPLQQVLPVAYALGLVPGAQIAATSNAPALTVGNAGSGDALQADGATTVNGNLSVNGSLIGGEHAHSGNDITSGTVAEPRIASQIARDAELEGAITGHADDSDAHHPRYTDPEAWSAVLARDGAGTGLDADKLDGQHGSYYQTRVSGSCTAGSYIRAIYSDGSVLCDDDRRPIVATSTNGDTVYLTNSCGDPPTGRSVAIETSGPGTVIIEANVWVIFDHTSGINDQIVLGIGSTPTDCDTSEWHYTTVWDIPSSFPSDGYLLHTFTVRRVVTVYSAGTYTFYLNGYMATGFSANTDRLWHTSMQAVFYPD